MNLQTGAFGDPTNIKTLILFWTKMEMLHYPGSGETRAYLEEELKQQIQAQQMQRQMQQAQELSKQRRQNTDTAGLAIGQTGRTSPDAQ